MRKIREKGTVIEVCPTSSMRIANLQKVSALPIWRFIENRLTVVLGSDDPGILKTDISGEYALIEDELKKKYSGEFEIKDLLENSKKSISEIISKKKP
jgi:adenosine deaminase